jgi:hypothetical protein
MKVTCLVPIGVLAAGAAAQASSSIFEPQDFNVTAALENLGVDVGALPVPASRLNARYSSAQCSLAVSLIVMQRFYFAEANADLSVLL